MQIYALDWQKSKSKVVLEIFYYDKFSKITIKNVFCY